MGTIYRSENMVLCQMFLQTDSAYQCVAELGELGLVQFRDLNPDMTPFQRKFVGEVRRCDEMERRLRFLEREMELENIKMNELTENPEAPQPREMMDLENEFERLENQLNEVNGNEVTLKQNFLELVELKYVLKNTSQFFDEPETVQATVQALQTDGAGYVNEGMDLNGEAGAAMPVISHEKDREDKSELSFIAGVVNRARVAAFERMLWRVCRGNMFLRQENIMEPLEDPKTREKVDKTVFIVFFQGQQLRTRIKKVCDGFRAKIYPCPDNGTERRETSLGVMTRLQDLTTVINQSSEHRRRLLNEASQLINRWFAIVRKMKSIYHTLNLLNLDVTQKALIAECWCPERDLDAIMRCLNKGTARSGTTVPSILNRMDTDEEPPTYFRSNKLTKGFQNIVDSYGIATYREVNPAPWTCITFPFLFAVMFGDMGHGLIMFLFGLFLCFNEKKFAKHAKPATIFATFFGGRYVVLLMGVFSMYTGLVYNEVYSKSVGIFGHSRWRNPYSKDVMNELFGLGSWDPKQTKEPSQQLNPEYAFASGVVYPVGFDPIWNFASNKLWFQNSFKMKMSVILGISQMTFGVLLSLLNHIYFKDMLSILCEFIPEILFLASLFMYLCALILFKWCVFGVAPKMLAIGFYPGTNCAPSLLTGFIGMFMINTRPVAFVNATNTNQSLLDCDKAQAYPHQQTVEAILLIVAVICIPWMLLIKPIVLNQRNKRHLRNMAPNISVHADINNDTAQVITEPKEKNEGGGGGGHGQSGPFDFGDAIVFQSIHTIEFCLGCISHTASYLRLWALSLAHAELAEVLWTMVVKQAFTMGGTDSMKFIGGIIVWLVFWAFAVLTVAILIMMEGLSAFLHALRLHWVEFQSKFYGGQGYSFIPFSFDAAEEEA